MYFKKRRNIFVDALVLLGYLVQSRRRALSFEYGLRFRSIRFSAKKTSIITSLFMTTLTIP